MRAIYLFKIEFYKDRSGNEKTVDYIRELNNKAGSSKDCRIRLKKIVEYFEVLSRFGTQAGEPYVKHIDDGIWELRPTNDRVFFFCWNGDTYIMLHHFIKKTQKTPGREIIQAKCNRADFLERNDRNEY